MRRAREHPPRRSPNAPCYFLGIRPHGTFRDPPANLRPLPHPRAGSPHPADVILGLTTLHEAVGNFVVPPCAPARDAPARHPFADALSRLAEARWVARFMEVAETHARDEATMTAMRDCVEDWTRRCGGSDAESARVREIFQALADACPGGAASKVFVAAAPAERRDSSEFLPRGMVEMSGLAPPPTMARGRVETCSGFLPQGLVEMSGMTRGGRRL